jgi:hypothetical protein
MKLNQLIVKIIIIYTLSKIVCPCILRNKPEERSSQLLRGRSLKLCIRIKDTDYECGKREMHTLFCSEYLIATNIFDTKLQIETILKLAAHL